MRKLTRFAVAAFATTAAVLPLSIASATTAQAAPDTCVHLGKGQVDTGGEWLKDDGKGTQSMGVKSAFVDLDKFHTCNELPVKVDAETEVDSATKTATDVDTKGKPRGRAASVDTPDVDSATKTSTDVDADVDASTPSKTEVSFDKARIDTGGAWLERGPNGQKDMGHDGLTALVDNLNVHSH